VGTYQAEIVRTQDVATVMRQCADALSASNFKNIKKSHGQYGFTAEIQIGTQWSKTPIQVLVTATDQGTLVQAASSGKGQSLVSVFRSPSKVAVDKFLKALKSTEDAVAFPGIDFASLRADLNSEKRAEVLPTLLEAAQESPEALDILIADALARDDLVQADHWQTRKRALTEPKSSATPEGETSGKAQSTSRGWFGAIVENEASDDAGF